MSESEISKFGGEQGALLNIKEDIRRVAELARQDKLQSGSPDFDIARKDLKGEALHDEARRAVFELLNSKEPQEVVKRIAKQVIATSATRRVSRRCFGDWEQCV